MTITLSEKSLLRSQFTSNATAQQPPPHGATGNATSSQQPPVKPLSLLDVARNKLRNNLATTPEKPAQQARFSNGNTKSLLRSQFTSNATAQQAQPITSWGWRVTYPDGRTLESYIVPVQSITDVRVMYQGAKVEPLLEIEV